LGDALHVGAVPKIVLKDFFYFPLEVLFRQILVLIFLAQFHRWMVFCLRPDYRRPFKWHI
jgi:hypothetical protein